MSWRGETTMSIRCSMRRRKSRSSSSDLINRILDKGVVIGGEVTIAVAGVDLVRLDAAGLSARCRGATHARSERAAQVSPVHLYGVLDADAALAPNTVGLDGERARALVLNDQRTAWVSDVKQSTLEATPARLREHDDVLRGATAAGYSVVPSLFGRLYTDDQSLIEALERNAQELDAAMMLVQRTCRDEHIGDRIAGGSRAGLDR